MQIRIKVQLSLKLREYIECINCKTDNEMAWEFWKYMGMAKLNGLELLWNLFQRCHPEDPG